MQLDIRYLLKGVQVGGSGSLVLSVHLGDETINVSWMWKAAGWKTPREIKV